MKVEIKDQEESLSESAIPAIEKRLGFSLPNEYRDFLKISNGGSPVPDAVKYEGEYFDYVSMFYSVRRNAYSNDLFRNIEEYRELIPSHYLPIGESPGGDVFCLSLKNEDYGAVYYWNHEEANYDGEPWEMNMIKLAASFNEFLDSLYEEK